MMGTRVFQRTFGSWILLALALVTAPIAARAEGFFDIYFGAGFPQDNEVDTSADDPLLESDLDFAYDGDIEWETTPSLGLRGGYWFGEYGPSFIGIGLDLSYYRAFEDASIGEIDVWATPITPLLMLRVPLGYSEDYPGGRVQPYGAIGPAFTLAAAQVELGEFLATDDFEAVGFGVGLDARAGLAVPLGRSFALFTEYRYTLVSPEFEDEIDTVGFDTEVEFEPELETHHLVFGVSFRF